MAFLIMLMSVMIETSAHRGVEFKSDGGFPNPCYPNFPIAAWEAFVINTVPTEQQFEWLKEAGINIVGEVIRDSTLISKVASKVADHNMKLVFASDYIGNIVHLPGLVDRFKGHPGVLGYMIRDEPKVADFGFCADRNKVIRQHDPNALGYVNLWPATNAYSNDYGQYLDDFIEQVKPRVLSVDIYPIRADGGWHIYTRYYETYEILLKKSKQYGIPWMACVASTDTPEFYSPNEFNMRFAAFIALAYGAQGIAWWSYCNRPDRDPSFILESPIENGVRTPLWYDMKKINEEIQRFRFVFMGCEVQRVWYIGKDNTDKKDYVVQVGKYNIRFIQTGLDFLLSHIRNNGKDFLVVINKNWEKSQLLVGKAFGEFRYYYRDGISRDLDDDFTYRIEAGGFVIFKLN